MNRSLNWPGRGGKSRPVGAQARWAKVIAELNGLGYDSLHAAENPLTSLGDDAERTQKMVKQVDGPVLPVGHSYGGAVISPAGDLPNAAGLVHVAAFAPDAGESLAQFSARTCLPTKHW